jgi:hypothetical protein
MNGIGKEEAFVSFFEIDLSDLLPSKRIERWKVEISIELPKHRFQHFAGLPAAWLSDK